VSAGGRNLPAASVANAPYWEACRRHELLIQRCRSCARHQFYPRRMCAACGADAPEWVRASGRAALSSFTVVRQPLSEAYAAQGPYVVALVALAEGPTMMSHVVGCDPAELAVGMALVVDFEDWPEGISLPVFRPVRAGPQAT
jgi:uncharacterized OB-fold protein